MSRMGNVASSTAAFTSSFVPVSERLRRLCNHRIIRLSYSTFFCRFNELPSTDSNDVWNDGGQKETNWQESSQCTYETAVFVISVKFKKKKKCFHLKNKNCSRWNMVLMCQYFQHRAIM